MSNYQEQYCEKHNQKFADYLPHCPICRGEKMIPEQKIVKETTLMSRSTKRDPEHEKKPLPPKIDDKEV